MKSAFCRLVCFCIQDNPETAHVRLLDYLDLDSQDTEIFRKSWAEAVLRFQAFKPKTGKKLPNDIDDIESFVDEFVSCLNQYAKTGKDLIDYLDSWLENKNVSKQQVIEFFRSYDKIVSNTTKLFDNHEFDKDNKFRSIASDESILTLHDEMKGMVPVWNTPKSLLDICPYQPLFVPSYLRSSMKYGELVPKEDAALGATIPVLGVEVYGSSEQLENIWSAWKDGKSFLVARSLNLFSRPLLVQENDEQKTVFIFDRISSASRFAELDIHHLRNILNSPIILTQWIKQLVLYSLCFRSFFLGAPFPDVSSVVMSLWIKANGMLAIEGLSSPVVNSNSILPLDEIWSWLGSLLSKLFCFSQRFCLAWTVDPEPMLQLVKFITTDSSLLDVEVDFIENSEIGHNFFMSNGKFEWKWVHQSATSDDNIQNGSSNIISDDGYIDCMETELLWPRSKSSKSGTAQASRFIVTARFRIVPKVASFGPFRLQLIVNNHLCVSVVNILAIKSHCSPASERVESQFAQSNYRLYLEDIRSMYESQFEARRSINFSRCSLFGPLESMSSCRDLIQYWDVSYSQERENLEELWKNINNRPKDSNP